MISQCFLLFLDEAPFPDCPCPCPPPDLGGNFLCPCACSAPAAAAAAVSVLPPRSGTLPITSCFTLAPNLLLSPLVALLPIATRSPAIIIGIITLLPSRGGN